MRSHKLNKLFFVISFMGAVALALPCLAERDGQKGGQGNRGKGDQGGRSAASGQPSTQASPRSSAIQSTPRGFGPQVGQKSAGPSASQRDLPKVSQKGQKDLPKTNLSDGKNAANAPRTFRQNDAPQSNRVSEPRVARGVDNNERKTSQQRSFYRGPSDQSSKDLRDKAIREQANLNRDRDRDGRSDDDRRDRVFSDRERSDRDRDRFARDYTRLRSDWNQRNRSNVPFRYGWWDSYSRDRWPVYGPWASARWRDRPDYWWTWTTANTLTPWLVFGWDRPRYWQYGPGANIYYQNDYVYYDGRQFEPVATYYDKIYALAHSVPNFDAAAAERMEWQPLGVFVASNDGRSGERSMQMAVSREGVLSGTYYNTGNGHVHPVSGMVDKSSQRAAWAFADGEHPKIVFETSLFNLTNEQATMMVHFGPSAAETEVWNLVRMEQPDASGALPGNPPQSAVGVRNELP